MEKVLEDRELVQGGGSPRASAKSMPRTSPSTLNARGHLTLIFYQAGPHLTSVWGFPCAQLVKNLPAMWETRVRSLGWEDPLEKGKAAHSRIVGLPLCSAGKESACNVGDRVRSLGWEDPLEKGKATHSRILARKQMH